MKNKSTKDSMMMAAIFIVIAAASRLLTMLPNFSAIEAISLFGGAVIATRLFALALPVIALYLSDFVINNTVARIYYPEVEGVVWYSDYMIGTFLSVVLIVLLGRIVLKNRLSIGSVAGTSIAGSLIFFLVTNTQAWISNPMYSKDFSGLLQSLTAGLPFLKTSMLSALIFSAILFGSYYLLKDVLSSSLQSEKVHL